MLGGKRACTYHLFNLYYLRFVFLKSTGSRFFEGACPALVYKSSTSYLGFRVFQPVGFRYQVGCFWRPFLGWCVWPSKSIKRVAAGAKLNRTDVKILFALLELGFFTGFKRKKIVTNGRTGLSDALLLWLF